MSSTSSSSGSAFPVAGLVPKQETGASRFLSSYPAHDGRAVLVAILDTGCDPGASGLQHTTDGKPKYVDFFDCSGSGDVDTSASVEAKADAEGGVQFVSPVTQRTLRLPAALAKRNPSARWQVGVKKAFELYPSPLVDRVKRERKRVFDEQQRKLEQALTARLASWDEDSKAAAAAATESNSADAGTDVSLAGSYPPSFTGKDKSDLEARLAEVRAVSAKYEDFGPVWDVLVWHDGTSTSGRSSDDTRERGWWVAVDSTGTGDFSHARALTNFAHGGEYATLDGVSLMNYTVNIYNKGKLVSLVTTVGSHGTHVAGIVAANESGPGGLGAEHNGLAPGVQLLSLRIGDGRLGSMETGVGLVRALIEAIRLKADVINLSYGEASSIPNSGRISELIRSAVFDHGITFVSSAGNNGPALSSSGSPGSTDSGVISVGAFVSPLMALACYSSRRAIPREGSMYSWSSRGPTTDGAQGVTISACGGAVTSVCEWQLQRTQLMNGTSMSSPACAGGIALLMSGLRARGLSWTPQRIKHAIQVTARVMPGIEPLEQGAGLLSVDKAFEHLLGHSQRADLDLHWKVTVPSTGGRGVYLRDMADTQRAHEVSVSIEPVFKEQGIGEAPPATAAASASPREGSEQKDAQDGDAPALRSASAPPPSSSSPSAATGGVANAGNLAHNKARVQFQRHIALECAAQWVDAPKHLALMHGGRTLSLVVHGETLEPGLHFTELLGYDADLSASDRQALGPLFRVPVTVCKVENASVAHSALVASSIQGGGVGDLAAVGPAGAAYKFPNLAFDSGRVQRKFVVVPEGATYADFTIRLHSLESGSDDQAQGAAPSASPSPSSSSGGPVSNDSETSRSFMFHALYLSPEESYCAHENNSFFSLSADAPTKEVRMDVRPGQTMELALAQYWSSLGACKADMEVSFGGVLVDGAPNGEMVLDASAPFTQVTYRSVLRQTKLAPTASIKSWCSPLRPQSATIVPLSPARDLIAKGHRLISALQLTYSFELKEDSSCVRLRIPALNERLYESLYEAQLTSIFDVHRRFLYATDAFEKGKALKAGKYTARVLVRHDDSAMLEKVKDASAVLELALGKSIDLPAYASYTAAASVGGSKFGGNKVAKPGHAGSLFLGLDYKLFPSFAKPGDWGTGTFTLAKGEFGGEKGGAIKLRVYAPAAPAPAAPAAASNGTAAPKKDGESPKKPAEGEQDPAFPKLEQKDPATSPTPTPATPAAPSATPNPAAAGASSSPASSSSPSSLAAELRDLTIAHLEKLKPGTADTEKKAEALRSVLPPLLAAFPMHLPLLFLELRFLHEVNQSRPVGSAEREEGGVLVASKATALLTEKIDQTALLAHFGRVLPSEKDAKDIPGATELLALRKEKEEVRRIVLKTIALQVERALEELRVSHRSRLRAVEFQAAARAELDALQAAAASSSPSAFALSLASFHSLLSEAGSWVDTNKDKEAKKLFAPFHTLATKLACHYGLLWKSLTAEQAAAATGAAVDSAALKALQQDKIELLAALAQHEPLYAHVQDYERDQLVVRFPKDYAPW